MNITQLQLLIEYIDLTSQMHAFMFAKGGDIGVMSDSTEKAYIEVRQKWAKVRKQLLESV